MSLTEPTLRRLTPADAAECAALAGSVAWTHSVPLWQQFIRWGGAGAMCLSMDDRIAVTAVALTYSPRLAWVGAVIAHPDFQGRGYAKQMMQHVMEHLKNVQSVMLDASVLGHPIYLKMGFRPLYKIEVWMGQPQLTAPSGNAESLSEADLPQVIQIDTQIQGISRDVVMRDMYQPGMAWVTREDGQINGYLLAQTDSRGVHFGPWYHPTPEGAEQLFQTAASAFRGQDVRIQFPEPNTAALELCQKHGLAASRHCTRMVFGDEPPGNMNVQHGIAAFATG